MGPIRNRVRQPSPYTHFQEDDFHINVNREEYGNKMREMFAQEPENRRDFVENFVYFWQLFDTDEKTEYTSGNVN